ncbi:hypothetical protein ACFFQW_25960 [Umezawaea endophytica]|uniref:Uncharacterized protein n=1 Tax=Umezawaea endophytica TaxID=1654476 RepID=A0A9X2VMD7_9PSEU|nr:hypothetical protein [Umezawaea endophytica]MCS7479074.1 hypothetical protein [Umezawaea endophytica]
MGFVVTYGMSTGLSENSDGSVMANVQSEVLASSGPGTILLLPDKISGGYALYRDDVAGVVKTARSNGIDVEFAYTQERRKYLSEFSASEVVSAIFLGVAGNLTTDVTKSIYYLVNLRAMAALRSFGGHGPVESEHVHLHMDRFEQDGEWRVIEGFDFKGPVGDVENVLRELMSRGDKVDDSRSI